MQTKTLKVSIIVFISLFLILIAIKTILACSWYEQPDNRDISVFTPEIIHQPAKEPFFLSYHSYYGQEGYNIPETAPTLTERNTSEWVSFFNNNLTEKDIQWLIYESTVEQVKVIQSLKRKVQIPDTVNKAVVLELREIKNKTAILDYILFAKKSEKYFNPSYYSYEPLVYDSTAINDLLSLAQKQFTKEKNKFLKNRYGFQVTRALSVAGKHDECVRFFDNEFKPSIEAGGMFYRSLGYKARSLYWTRDYTMANYWYAYLFDNDPCSRYQAYQSFHPQEEDDWNNALKLAQTTRQKEVLWELLGLYADPIRALKEIYALNPESDLQALLLVRSVNLIEENMLRNPQREYNNFYEGDAYSKETGQPAYDTYNYSSANMDGFSRQVLLAFVNDVVREKKINDLPVWQLAAAYLSMLNEDYISSAAVLNQLDINKTDSLMLGQAEILKGILAVRKLETIGPETETEIYSHIEKITSFKQPALRSENAIRYMLSRLSLCYDNKDDLLKKELAYPQGKTYYNSSTATQQMIDFMNRTDMNKLEKFMLARYPLNPADLHDVKAVAFMYEYDFAKAVEEFSKTEGSGSKELYGNPFNIHIVDCHDCDHSAVQKIKYTKYSFAKKMVELKAKGDSLKDSEAGAQNYFLYANGVYNMTWYGNARLVHETSVSIDNYFEVIENNKNNGGNFFNCSEALKYYLKAFGLSKDKEFRAKCTWMAAKCEHNLWLDNGMEESDTSFVAGIYFQKMKKDFSTTEYYRDIINECGYFCTYITGAPACIRNRDQ